jgi:hypothetical protein
MGKFSHIWYDDSWDDILPDEPEFETELEPEPIETAFYQGQRGVLGDLFSLGAEAVVTGLETIENAAEYFNVNDSEVDSVAKLRQFSLLKPDVDEYFNRGWMQETAIGSARDVARTVGGSLTAAGIGLGAGVVMTPAGASPVIGGLMGSIISSFGVMGSAEYQQTYETAIEQGKTEEEARALATKNGLTEGLGEAIGTAIGLGPLTKGLTKAASQPLKNTLKAILGTNPKDLAKQLLTVYTQEQATEFTQAGLQNKFLRDAGLSDVGTGEALLKTILPTLFLTGAFNAGTTIYTQRQKSKIRKALNSGNVTDQMTAIEMVRRNLEQEDAEIAKAWDVYSKWTIASGEKIKWNEEFDTFSDELLQKHGQKGSLISEEDIIKGGPVLAAKIEAFTKRGLFTNRDLDFFREEQEWDKYEPDVPAIDIDERTGETRTKKAVRLSEEARLKREQEGVTAAQNAEMEDLVGEIPEGLPEGQTPEGQLKRYEAGLKVPGQETPEQVVERVRRYNEKIALVKRLQEGRRKAKEARTQEQRDAANQEANEAMDSLLGEYDATQPAGERNKNIFTLALDLLIQNEQDAEAFKRGELTIEQAEQLRDYNDFIQEREAAAGVPVDMQSGTFTEQQLIDEYNQNPEAFERAAIEEALANQGLDTAINVGEAITTDLLGVGEDVEGPGLKTFTTPGTGERRGAGFKVKTVLDWEQDTEMTEGQGYVGVLPGNPDVTYRIVKNEDGTYQVGVTETTPAGEAKTSPLGQGKGLRPGQHKSRNDAIAAADTHAKTQETSEWTRGKGARSITIDGSTYTVKTEGKKRVVLKDGQPFANPNNKNGKWTKRVTVGEKTRTDALTFDEVESIIEGTTGYTPENTKTGKAATPVAPAPAEPVEEDVEPTEKVAKRPTAKERWADVELTKKGNLRLKDRAKATTELAVAERAVEEARAANAKQEIIKRLEADRAFLRDLLGVKPKEETITVKENGKDVTYGIDEYNKIIEERLAKEAKTTTGERLASAEARAAVAELGEEETATEELARLQAEQEAELAAEEEGEIVGALPQEETGTPTEKTAYEIIEKAADEGNPIAIALLRRVSKDKLDLIPVAHKPSEEGSHFDTATGEIVLKGDNQSIKIEEVIHAITVGELAASPEIQAEVEGLMDIFRNHIEENNIPMTPAMEYALSHPREFLGTGITNQEVQELMKGIPQEAGVFKNLWNKFVDFIRKTVGLPAIQRNMLAQALDITVKLSKGEPVSVPADKVRALVGKKAKLTKEQKADLKTAEKMNKQGVPMQEIMEKTGWFQFKKDPKWRYYISEKGLKVSEDFSDRLHEKFTEVSEFNFNTAPYSKDTMTLKDILDTPALEAYPEIADYPVDILWNEKERAFGSFDPATKRFEINMAQLYHYYSHRMRKDSNGELIKTFKERPVDQLHSIAVQQAKKTLKHEVQHAIQDIEGYQGGGNMSVAAHMTPHLIAQSLADLRGNPDLTGNMDEVGTLIDLLNDEESLEALTQVQILEQGDPDYNAGIARLEIMVNLIKQINAKLEDGSLESMMLGEYIFMENPQLAKQLEYVSQGLYSYEGQQLPIHEQNLKHKIEIDTYMRILGEAEARLAADMGYTVQDFRKEFNIQEWESKEKPLVPFVETGAVTKVEERAVDDRPTRTTEERVDAAFAGRDTQAETITGEVLAKSKDFLQKTWELLKDLFQPMNDRLENIHISIGAMNRVAESWKSNLDKEHSQALAPLLQKLTEMNKSNPKDYTKFKMGFTNTRDRQLMFDVAKQYGFTEELNAFLDILKSNESELVRIGALAKDMLEPDYIPRLVKHDKLLELYRASNPEIRSELDVFIDKKRQEVEAVGGAGSFTDAHRREAIAQALNNGRFAFIPQPGYLKPRAFSHVPTDLLQYYADPRDVMVDYIYKINEYRYQQKVSGKLNRGRDIQALLNISKKIEKLRGKKKELTDDQKNELLELMENHAELSQRIVSLDEDLSRNVSTMLDDPKYNLTEEQKQEALKVLQARFAQRGTHGAVHAIKNVSLMISIGNPMSAITQLGDQGINLSDNGRYGLVGMAHAMTGESIIDNFDVENAIREFSVDSRSSAMLDKVLELSQLKRMDIFGKESYVQGLMEKISNMSLDEFKGKYGHYGEFLLEEGSADKRIENAYNSIADKKPTKDAMYLLFSELARRQPVSLSESSVKFATGGNARIFYMLKQFSLRSIGSAIRDIQQGFISGNPTQGIIKAIGLITLLGLAGAGTDEIKNLILQREGEELSDAVVSNILELMFVNRYSLETGMKQGKPFHNIISNNIMLPPVRAIDDTVDFIWKGLQGEADYALVSHLPMFGRIVYDYTPQGREAELKRNRRHIMEQVREGVSPGKLRKDINIFNRSATGEAGLEKITSSSIKSARKRAREEARK